MVVRLYLLDDPHYILLTGVQGEQLCAFDPYLPEEPLPEKDIVMTDDHPYAYNRVIPFSYFNHTGRTQYALGETARREAVLLFNTRTQLPDRYRAERSSCPVRPKLPRKLLRNIIAARVVPLRPGAPSAP